MSKFEKVEISEYVYLDEFSDDTLPMTGVRWSCSRLEDKPDLMFINVFHDKTIMACIQYSVSRKRIVKIAVPPSQTQNESAVFFTGLLRKNKRPLCDAFERTFNLIAHEL